MRTGKMSMILKRKPKEKAGGGCPFTPCSRSIFRAADIVHHAPSGEDWVLAVDEENGRVQPCGWPPTMADAKDCTLTAPATAEYRIVMLQEWATEGKGYEHERDSRTRTARHQLSSENR